MANVTVVGSRQDLPRESYYVYHETDERNTESILSEGLNPTRQSADWMRLNEFLETVAENEGITQKPSHRGQCVFSFPRFADVAEDTRSNAVFAIDLRRVDADLYRGSYHKATKLYELIDGNSTSVASVLDTRAFNATAQSMYEAAIDYWNSVCSCSPPVTRGGEVLIEGTVSPEAITHIYK